MALEVSVSGAFRNFETNYGYGRAAYNILNGFSSRGVKWRIDDPSYDIEIFWGHPPYEFQRFHHYKIGYTAWESTGLKKDWGDTMKDADELWTPTEWLTEHFGSLYPDKPTFTYPHGVDDIWVPKRHYRPDSSMPFTFLHIGEPQFRKNGQLVVDAFRELFGNDENYRLIMKTSGINTTRIMNHSGSIVGTPDSIYRNITLIDAMLSDEQLVALHDAVDALVYPTAGEGFGFHPLEALASGLPTITTTGWCRYQKYVTVPIETELTPTLWPDLHPGMMFNVTKEQVKNAMIDMVENYDKYAGVTFKNAFHLRDEYSWSNQNSKAVKRLEIIQKSRT